MNEDLWERWRARFAEREIPAEKLSKDGPLSLYENTEPRVVFVLKETDDFENADLPAWLKDGPRYQMWYAIARWAAGILGGFPPFEDIDEWDVYTKALNSIGVVNLKKETGGSSSWGQQLNAYAYADRDLLREQLESLKPDIVIACGVYDQLVWLLEPDAPPDQIAEGTFKHGSATVLSWRHPARVNNRKTYGELADKLGSVVARFNRP